MRGRPYQVKGKGRGYSSHDSGTSYGSYSNLVAAVPMSDQAQDNQYHNNKDIHQTKARSKETACRKGSLYHVTYVERWVAKHQTVGGQAHTQSINTHSSTSYWATEKWTTIRKVNTTSTIISCECIYYQLPSNHWRGSTIGYSGYERESLQIYGVRHVTMIQQPSNACDFHNSSLQM
eukprot:1363212-Amphidinium_carterae.2